MRHAIAILVVYVVSLIATTVILDRHPHSILGIQRAASNPSVLATVVLVVAGSVFVATMIALLVSPGPAWPYLWGAVTVFAAGVVLLNLYYEQAAIIYAVTGPLIAVVGSTRKIRLASRTANLPAAVALWGLVVAWLPVDVWFLSALDVFQVLFPGYARAG